VSRRATLREAAISIESVQRFWRAPSKAGKESPEVSRDESPRARPAASACETGGFLELFE